MSTCRDLPPLPAADLGALELYLDTIGGAQPVSSAMARRLMATVRRLEQQLAASTAQEAAAWALLAADCAEHPPP